MKKIVNIFVVLSILTFGLLVAAVYASESDPKGWERSYQTSEIIGSWVTNHQGKYLGRVQDLVFDPAGHVIFAIIGYSRFNWRLIGENSVAVPFNALVYDRNAKHPGVVVDISFEKFQSAPRFSKTDLTDRQREAEVYRYFGQQPYWTERGTTGTGSPSMEKPTKGPMVEWEEKPGE
jgi:sporulation protein YlmC with PRC-barrel domain